ncbi:MAG: hypothetical protein IJ397_08190 [Lachnospiraceae bacterium]|nr:hypothetical protein [Lachnospiraceae bacterium]MBQ7766807.1 hypothetical protein [Lachnospiraceae bacterium]
MLLLISSEMILYSGIALMVCAIILAIFCAVLFSLTGKKIRKKLMAEYGENRLKVKKSKGE